MPWLTPFLHVPALLHQKWDANVSIPLIRKELPVLGLAGEKDEIVHPTQMTGIKALREKAGGKLMWKTFANGTHSEWSGHSTGGLRVVRLIGQTR